MEVPHIGIPTDTFGGEDYKMDIEENLGYRTPFRDADTAQAEKIFDDIIKARRQRLEASSTE